MESAPAWVSFAAVAMSAGSLAVSFLAYRAGGPRVRLESRRLSVGAEASPFPSGVPVQLTVVNSGRAAVTVEKFYVTHYGSRKRLARVEDIVGTPLPYRLEAHASETWVIDGLPVAREVDGIDGGRDDPLVGPAQFRFVAALGNGKSARGGFNYTPARFIADARRDT